MRISRLITYCVFCFLFGCNTDKKTKNEKELIRKFNNTEVRNFDYDGLKPFLHKKEDTIYVVNFWATWCKPCVEELPAFEKLYKNYKDSKVEVLLVSLDFPKQKESRLLPFIKTNKIMSKVVLLDDENEQRWISEIDKDWSGAIPATLIYSKNKRKFYEQSFDYTTLEKNIKLFMN